VLDHHTSPPCFWVKRAQARSFFTRAPARSSRATPPPSSGLRATGTAAEPLSAGAPGGGARWYRMGNRAGARRRSRWKRLFDFPILGAGDGN
jgi:hypothetical protein